ncbi:MAG: CARDB domain-containing protein [Acidobacteriota bacterium]
MISRKPALILACLLGLTRILPAQGVSVGGDSTINKCETKAYYIEIQNNSGNPLTSIVVTARLGNLTGFSYVNGTSILQINGGPAFCTVDPTPSGTNIVWDIDTDCGGGPYTLNNGDSLRVTFGLATDCTAVSGSLNSRIDYEISGTPMFDETGVHSIQVLPGGVTIKKTPNVIPQRVGQNVTWTLTVENSGLGMIENVEVTDVLGAGLLYVSSNPAGVNAAQTTMWSSTEIPGFASMTPGETITIDITATVIACENLDNTADVRWGCSSSEICFDTATDGGTATASVQRIPQTPNLSFTPPDITFTYCENTSADSVTITNVGDGVAYDVRLCVDFSPLTVVGSSAPYNIGCFEIPDIPAGGSYVLDFTLGYSTWCGGATIAKTLIWIPTYADECGNAFYPPIAISSVNSVADQPSLSVTKTGGPAEIQIGAQVTYTITSAYAGPLSCGTGGSVGIVTVVDTVPNGFTVVDAGGGTWVPGGGGTGGTITWTYMPPASLSTSITLQAPDVTQCETYCFTTFTNSVTATVVDCCGCTLNASASQTTAIECEEQVDSNKTANPATVERCDEVQYTNTYDFSAGATMNLNTLVFEEHAENQQDYVPGSLSVVFDGSDITGCVSITDATPGGYLLLDFSGCAASAVAGRNLTIVYRLAITEATVGACSGTSFYSWSGLDIGTSGNQCLQDGVIYETTVVNVEAPAMSVALSGLDAIIDKCKTESVTLTLSQTSAVANPRDVRLVLSGLNYYIVNPAAVICSGAVAPTSCTPAIVGDDYVWYFADGFTGSGQSATLQMDVQKRCTGGGDLTATAYFDDQCNDDATYDDMCSVSGTDSPLVLLSGDLLIEKTPEVYYAATNTIVWKIYLTNRGTGVAYNVWVDDVLGSGLDYVSAVVDNMTGVTITADQDHNGGAINGATISIAQITAGARREITFTALLIDCDNLTNDVTSSWGCGGLDCQTAVSDSSTVEIPAPLLVNTNVVTTPADSCSSPSGMITVKNAGQTTTYNVQLTETLPAGLLYVSGTTRWRLNGGAWNGPDPAYDPDPTTSPILWTPAEIPGLAELDAGDTVEIDYDLLASCLFTGGNTVLSTSYENPCGQVFTNADSVFTVALRAPQITVTKTRVDEPIDCGQLVEWTITVQNTSGYTLPIIWVEDTMDAAYTYSSSVGDPPFTSDDGTFDGVNTVAWELLNVNHNDTVTLILRATSDSSPCSPDLDNTVLAWWGCGAADGSSATKPGADPPDDNLCLTSTSVSAVRTETREPDLAVLSVQMTPSDIDSCNDSTTVRIVIENSGPTDASDLDLVTTLPAGLSYNAGSSQTCIGTDDTCALAPVLDPAPAGSQLTYYNLGDKSSDIANVLQAAGGNDTLVLELDLRSNCYTTANMGIRLYYYDCCGDTQYNTNLNQTITAVQPSLTITKTPLTSQVDCGDPQTWTITVTNTGTGNAQVIRVEDTPGDWIDVNIGASSPGLYDMGGGVYGWEFNNLAGGASQSFSLVGALNPDGFPNQADCAAALRQNVAATVWGCGTSGDATDGDPRTQGYDCTYGTATSATATLQMPDLVMDSISPSISCTSDGTFSGSISVTVRNSGDGIAYGPFTVQVTDGTGWTGTGTYAGNLGSGSSANVTIDTSTWNPDCSPCTYNITATADSAADVCECNEANNSLGPQAYTPSVPDVQVDGDTLAMTCVVDGQYRISGQVTLRNAGCAGTLTQNVPMRFTLHSGAGCTGAQVAQWTETFTGVSIAAGATQAFTITNYTITGNACTSATACEMSVLAEADYTNAICESDGTNNTRCSDKTFTIPDLRVDSDTLAISCSADGQIRIQGNLVIANDGCGANLVTNIPIRIRVYNSDAACSGANGVITFTQAGVNIPAGGTQAFAINRTLNRNLCTNSTGCQVAVGVELDYTDVICECTNTNNNYCSPNKTVSIPDLQVTGDTLAVSCLQDGQVRVSGDVTVANTGCNAAVAGNLPVRFTLFSNINCGGAQLAQWTETFAGANIAAGASQVFTITNRDIITNICANSTGCQVSLRIEADPAPSTICECNGGNNSRCANKNVSVPDLRITALTPLVSCASDGSLSGTVQVTVNNNGCGAANNVPVRLVSDCGYTFTDQTVVALAAGASTTLTFAFTPDISRCTCAFTATADPDNVVCECDGTDNSLASAPYTSPVPDLTITDIDFSGIICANDNVSGSVSVTVRNEGCGTAGNFQVALATDGCLSFSNQVVGSLAAGASTTLTFNVSGSWADCADGSCDFTATADSTGTVCEYDGTNNNRTETYSLSLPDLVVSDIDFSGIGCANDNISGSVSVTVENRGSGAANNFQVALATDGCLTFTNQTVAALAAGASTTVTFNVSGSWPDCTDCSCDFTATVDPTNAVCECDGTNNSRTETYSFDLPDLTVNSVTPQASCTSDGSLSGTVTVNVSNIGCGAANSVVVRLTSDCGHTFSDQTINLAAGAGTNVVFNYTPTGTACTCTFAAAIDPDNAICECNGTNNSASAAPYTHTTPDLTVTDIDFSGITCAADNVAGSVSVTIANQGCGTAANFEVSLGTDGCLTFSNQAVGSLAAGASTTLTFNVSGSWADCADGSCDFTATVDATGVVCELDGGNNARTETYSSTMPDLVVNDIDFSGIACTNDSISGSVSVTIQNRGFGPANNFEVALATDGCLTFTSQTISLAAGATTTLTFPVSGSWNGCSDCDCVFTASVDPTNVVCECDGTNNTRTETHTSNLPNLVVSAVATNVICLADGSATGTNVTVANTGCAGASNVVVRLFSDCGLTFADRVVNLAAGETRDVIFLFTPGIVSCTCNFTATIDPDNTICECDGTDNTLSGAAAMEIPDIEVQTEAITVACAGDGQYEVSGTVSLVNNGCGPALTANIPIRMTLFGGSGCTGTVLAQWTETLTSVNTPSAGGTQSFTITPSVFSGDFCAGSSNCGVSLLIEADYNESICEWDGTDNTLCVEKTISVPDVALTSLVPSIACNTDGDVSGTLTAVAANNGCAPVTDDFRISVDDGQGWTASLWYNAQLGGPLPLARGASATLTIDWARDWTPQPYVCSFPSVTVTLDSERTLCECTDDNNTATTSIAVALPDLAVQAMSAECQSDGMLDLQITVANLGCADITSDFDLTIAASHQSKTVSFKSLGGALPLRAGVPQTLTVTKWAFDCGAARLDFTITADPDESVCELSSANNVLSWTYPIGSPDLLFGDISWTCNADGSINFTIVVKNDGHAGAPGATLSVYDERGTLIHSEKVSPNGGGQSTVTFTTPPYSQNQGHTFRFRLDGSDDVCECDGANNEESTVVKCPYTPEPVALITGKTTSGGSNVNACGEVEFVLTVQNVGSGYAYDVVITDILPPGFEYVLGSTRAEWPAGSSTADPSTSGRQLVWKTGADLAGGVPVGDTLTLRFRAKAPSCGSGGRDLTDTIKATANDAGGDPVPPRTDDPDDVDPDDSSSYTVHLLCPHLKVTRQCPPVSEIGDGGVVEYTIVIANDGDPGSELTMIEVIDRLPAGWTLQSFTSDPAQPVSAPSPGSAGTLHWDYGDYRLQPGSPIRLTVRITAGSAACGTTLDDPVTVTARDDCGTTPYSAEPATCPVRVTCGEPLLEFGKICPVAEQPGGIFVFELVVRNPGDAALDDVRVHDNLPDNFQYVPGSTAVDGSAAADPTIDGQLLKWSLGRLDAHTEIHLIFSAVVPADTDPGRYCNLGWAEGTWSAGKRLVSDQKECCVITRRESVECCIEVDQTPISWDQPPDNYISMIDPYFRTEPAMLASYAALDLWEKIAAEPETPAHFVKERLRNYALATVEEFYLRSRLGVVLDDGTLRLSAGGAYPESGDEGWTASREDSEMTASQIAIELLALNRAVRAEEEPDARTKLDKLIEERLAFVRAAISDLPHSWKIDREKADRQDEDATLHDRAVLYLSMSELSRAGRAGADLLAGELLKSLKPVDTEGFDRERPLEELFFTLALLENGRAEQAALKIREFEKLYAAGEVKPDTIGTRALASFVDARAGGTLAREILSRVEKDFLVPDAGILAEPQSDMTYSISLRDYAALLLAYQTRFGDRPEETAGILYRMTEDTGLFLREKNLAVGRTPLALIRNDRYGDERPPVLPIERGTERLASVFTESVSVRSPRMPAGEESLFPNKFAKMLSPRYEESTSQAAALSHEAQFVGRLLMKSPERVVREAGRSLDEFGKSYVVALMDSGAGARQNGTLVVPERDVATKGSKQGLRDLEPLRTGIRYDTESFADYALASRMYVDAPGKRIEDAQGVLLLQRKILDRFGEAGYVPESFEAFVDGDGTAVTVLPSSEKARKMAVAKLAAVFTEASIKKALEPEGEPLISEDLLFLAMKPELAKYFQNELRAVVDRDERGAWEIAADVVARRLLGFDPSDSMKKLLDVWDADVALPPGEPPATSSIGPVLRYDPPALLLYLLARHDANDFRFRRTLSLFGTLIESEWSLRWEKTHAMLPPSEFWLLKEGPKSRPEDGDLVTFGVRVENRCPVAEARAHDIPALLLKAEFLPSPLYAGTEPAEGLNVLKEFLWSYRDFVEGDLLSYRYQVLLPRDLRGRYVEGRLWARGYSGYEQFGPDSAAGLLCEDVDPVELLPIVPLKPIQAIVYHDVNVNGILDAGERGIPGIAFKDTLGRVYLSDAEGRFDVAAGDQHVGLQIELKSVHATYVLTTAPTRLLNRDTGGPVQFGMVSCVTLRGVVYEDANDNGVYDDGEPRPQGAVLKAGEKHAVTGPGGTFELRNLPEAWIDTLDIDSRQPFLHAALGKLRIVTSELVGARD